MKKILVSVLLLVCMFAAMLPTVYAAHSYVLNVGETKTLYPTKTIGKKISSGAWTSNQPFNVKINSYTGSTTSCRIEAAKPTTGLSGAVIHFEFKYYITSGSYKYLASGYEDFYVVVNSSNQEVVMDDEYEYIEYRYDKENNEYEYGEDESVEEFDEYDNVEQGYDEYECSEENDDENDENNDNIEEYDDYEFDEEENDDYECEFEYDENEEDEEYDEYEYNEDEYEYDDEDYCVVYIDLMGGKIGRRTTIIDTVEYGHRYLEPDEPVRDDYIFTGWYYDEDCEEEFDFARKIKNDIKIYAGWKKNRISRKNKMILTIGEKEAKVFGKTMVNDVAPIIRRNRTMLPARFVAENLGAEVGWASIDGGIVQIRTEDTEIIIYIDSVEAYVNGKKVILDSPAFIEHNRTYTPIRFIAENLGATVEWNEEDEEVIIIK